MNELDDLRAEMRAMRAEVQDIQATLRTFIQAQNNIARSQMAFMQALLDRARGADPEAPTPPA